MSGDDHSGADISGGDMSGDDQSGADIGVARVFRCDFQVVRMVLQSDHRPAHR